jgi:chromosome segregation ATPase
MTDTNINIVFAAIDQNVKKVLNEMQKASAAASAAMNNMVADTRKHIGIGRSQVLSVQDTSKAFEKFSQSISKSGQLIQALEEAFPSLRNEVDGIRRVFNGYAKALITTNDNQSRFNASLAEGETQLSRIGNFALKETFRRTSEFARGLGGLQVQMQRLNKKDMPAWASAIEEQGTNTQALAMQNHLLAGNIKTVGNELRFKNAQVMRDVGFNERAISQLGRLNDSYLNYYKMVDAATGQSKQFGNAVKQFGDYFGKSNQQVQIWGKALTDSSRAVTRLKNESNMLGGVMPGLSNSIKTSAVAYGVMQRNIEIAGGKIRVLNQAGLDSLGISEATASRLQILSKNYSVYENQLAQVANKSKANVNVFKSLASIYDKNTLALERISKAVNDADRVTGKYAASYKNKAQVVGEATREGQKYLRQAKAVASEENKLKVATDLVNGSYVVKNDRLKSTLKNLTDHKKSILEAAAIYGKGSTQLKEYSRGLVQLGYKATDSSKHTRNLRNSFLNTIKAVDNYKNSFPELTKNLNALNIHQAKVSGHISQIGTKLRINNKEGLQAAKMTESQASSVNMLANSYSQFENLIGKVAKVSKGHVPVIRDLAETYGYTQQNVKYLGKAWDDALTSSKREIGTWKERKNVLKAAGQDYSAIDDEIKRLSDRQLINQKIADNFHASMARSGIGVSAFSQFVQKASDKLKIAGPLQTAYVKGLTSLGLTADSTGSFVQRLGNDFHKVYESMLTMGARAGLSSKQMEGLMNNTKVLTDVTKGWSRSYKSMQGEIYALDEVTGKWLKTQINLDQAGKAQLITSKRLGASYGSYFGEVEKTSATWTRTVNNASRALGSLQAKSDAVGGTLPRMTRQIKVSDMALGVLQGNIDLTGNKIQVLNQKGLDQINTNKNQAEQLGILSKRFNTYQTELSKVGGAASKNGQVFSNLAKQYNFNEEALSGLSNTVKQSEKVVASAARRYIDKANAVGVDTEAGRKYIDQANRALSVEGRMAVASQLLTNKYEIQNGRLVDLGKDMTNHQRLMNEVAASYGAGTPKFKAFEQGLKDIQYQSHGTGLENRKLGNSFLQTFNAVERYKRAYPELAKDLNAVEVHHARLAKAISIVDGNFRINNDTGLKVLKQTQAQSSEMGMLSKSYHEMEGLIQKVSSYSKEHGTVIRDLANKYGYTSTNANLLNKSYKQAADESARLTAQWNNERTALAQQGKDVSEATKNLGKYSSQQFIAQQTATNYEAAINRSGIGVSKYSQFVQQATDKLQLSAPLQTQFVSGLKSVGVVSNATGVQLRSLGTDFTKVYDAMMTMGARAGLSSQQLNQLMSNTDTLKKTTEGLNKTYKIKKGVIYEVDKVTGKYLETQIAIDKQGRASLETTKRMGVGYGTSFGQAQSSALTWTQTVDKASKAVGYLRTQSKAIGGDLPQLANQLKTPSVALGVLQGNIEVVGNRLKILNEEGRKLTPYSEQQARSLGILSDSYSNYQKGLALATKGGKQNVEIFKQLSSRYSENAEILKKLPSLISDASQRAEQLSARYQKQAKAVGLTTAEGQNYLIKSKAILTTQGKMWVANQLVTDSYDVQHGQLVNLSSAMKSHQKMMFNAAAMYGKNSEQFKAFETGLKKVGYVAGDASDFNKKLGDSFSKTFQTVERYKKAYPEMAKNLDAINFEETATGIKRMGNEFQISNKQQLEASTLTRRQASQMGMLKNNYDEMESVIQRVSKQEASHGNIIRDLADKYGYTKKMLSFFPKHMMMHMDNLEF